MSKPKNGKSARRLLRLLKRDKACKCHWCARRVIPVIQSWKLPIHTLTSTHITLKLKSGRLLKRRLANVDHIKEVSRGGTSDLDNLVMACVQCNHKRSRQSKKIRTVCRTCGCDKPPSTDKHCERCCVDHKEGLFNPKNKGDAALFIYILVQLMSNQRGKYE